MRFAWIERDNHTLAREIDFNILHPWNLVQHRSQFAHTLIAIFTFSGDFDRFENSVVGTFREKWISRIGISRSCRVHRVLIVSLSNVSGTRTGRLLANVMLSEAKHLGLLP